MKARLIGGPCDGDIVPVIGVCFEKTTSYSFKTRELVTTIYKWEMRGEEVVGVVSGTRTHVIGTSDDPIQSGIDSARRLL